MPKNQNQITKKHTKNSSVKSIQKILNHPKNGLVVIAGVFTMASSVFIGISYAQNDTILSANSELGYSGNNAINRLSNRLPDVANKYYLSPEKLKDLLQRDATLRISDKDELFYVEPALNNEEIAKAASNASAPDENISSASQENIIPPENALNLHSKLGSNKTLYLDFDGHTTADEHWTKYNSGSVVVSAPYDHDGYPETFSTSERQSIVDIWASVAEDFSHLDINVTTKDPGMDALIKNNTSDTAYGNRTVITPSNFYSSSAGGVSYVGTWGMSKDYVSYVFICCDVPVTKYIAEAASHESGHSVGLHHDGTATEAYYEGHGNWAPIMGVGYYKPFTQWSKGEYLGANQKQDDLAFPLRYGIAFRPDEAGNKTSNATPLNLSKAGESRNGFIGNSTDIDMYAFNWLGGLATFEVGSPVYVQTFTDDALNAGNLDPSIRILNVLGAVETQSNPDGPGTASVSKTLLPGKYYLEIKGSGYLEPGTTGYSNYSSVGQYKILQR